jgi:predicted RNase H-like HicB family nuclease
MREPARIAIAAGSPGRSPGGLNACPPACEASDFARWDRRFRLSFRMSLTSATGCWTWHYSMVEIEPLQVEIEREEDGRFLASVPDLPGLMAYGETEESALRKAKAIALQVLADMVENGEELPQPLRVLFAA